MVPKNGVDNALTHIHQDCKVYSCNVYYVGIMFHNRSHAIIIRSCISADNVETIPCNLKNVGTKICRIHMRMMVNTFSL